MKLRSGITCLAGVAVAASSLFLASGRAQAAPPPASKATVVDQVFGAKNPLVAYGSLSPADKKFFDDHEIPASTTLTLTGTSGGATGKSFTTTSPQAASTFAAAASGPTGCSGLTVSAKAVAAGGNVLYTFWQHTDVCYSQGNVWGVAVDPNRTGGETSTPGWRIDKGPDLSAITVGWEGRGVAQFHFVLGIGGWDIQHPNDCLQARLNADGYHYLWNKSCNINS